MDETKKAELRAKLAELRRRYAILKAVCGPRGISEDTLQEYTKLGNELLTQLKAN